MTTIENQTGTASEQAPGRLPDDLREGYAEIGDVRLHYVEAGEGPLVADIRGLIHARPSRRRKPTATSRLPVKN